MTLNQEDGVFRPISLRPPRHGMLDAINHCSFCGQHLWTTADTDRHWEMGHFDRLINPNDPDYPEALKSQVFLGVARHAWRSATMSANQVPRFTTDEAIARLEDWLAPGYPFGDARYLAEAIRTVLDNHARLRSLYRRCRERESGPLKWDT